MAGTVAARAGPSRARRPGFAPERRHGATSTGARPAEAEAERYLKALSQEKLGALGAWRNPCTGEREAPLDSTLCRVMADTGPDALRQVLARRSAPRAEVDAVRT